jgi:hypothetical protein
LVPRFDLFNQQIVQGCDRELLFLAGLQNGKQLRCGIGPVLGTLDRDCNRAFAA